MPSTYSPNLRIELIANGEQSGTWGTTTNVNLGTLIEDAIAGYVSVSVTSANQALTALDGAADQSRNMVLNLTTTTTAAFNVYIPPAEKFYVVRNASAYNATIYCSTVLGNTTAAGLGVTVLANATTIIFSDGTNVRVAIDSFSGSSLVAANLTVNGNTTLGDASTDTLTINATVQPGVIISGSSSGDALRITQTGTGNALLVEDSTNPDSSPFVVDASGNVIQGNTSSLSFSAPAGTVTPTIQAIAQASSLTQGIASVTNVTSANGPNFIFGKSRGASASSPTIVSDADVTGTISFTGYDGAAYLRTAQISANVDGTPGTNDMPGRLVFSTTADGAATPTERMRIGSTGVVAIGSTTTSGGGSGCTLRFANNITGAVTSVSILGTPQVQSDVTTSASIFSSLPSTQAAAFTLTTLNHYLASQGTFGAGSTVTNQYGFHANSTLTGATNNYGFYSNIASGTGRWNFYANGTATNYFGGNTIVEVTDNTNAALRITQLGTGNALLIEDSTSPDSTPIVVDQSGIMVLGATTNQAANLATGNAKLQILGGTAPLAFFRDADSSTAINLEFAKRRATGGVLQSGDIIGRLYFSGNDGTAAIPAAFIDAAVDGTPGTNDMPGRLVFSTTADGAATPTERMRINSSGNVGIGTSSPSEKLTVSGNASLSGNLTFTGTGNRITGDFSNATFANRVAFQTSTVNGITTVNTIPNGTGTASQYQSYNAADPTNSSLMSIGVGATDVAIQSAIRGTGTYLPMTFYTGGSEAMRIDTSRYVQIGTATADGQVHIKAAAGQGVPLTLTSTDAGGNPQVMVKGSRTYQIGTGNASSGFAGQLFFYDGTAAATRMIIDSSGNVGIGTTSPSQKLQIAGGNSNYLRVDDTTNSVANLFGSAVGNGVIGTFSNHPLLFHTNSTERARITSGGYSKFSNDGSYVSSTDSYHEFTNTANLPTLFVRNTNASQTDVNLVIRSTRAANSAYNFLSAESGNGGDTEFRLRGDGNGYADGTWNNNGADYAEFFESVTGAALTLGATVVLDGNKVREATDQDPVSAIMGVVRPKEPSKASMVVGNTAWNKWANKYLTDDFDRYIMEDNDVFEWTDEEGKLQTYESHNIPAGVTVPDDAVVKTHDDKGNKFQHYKLNPAWNPDAEYINRENRPEWIIVGLVGQVKILKGQPVNDRWIKMRNVSSTVEEWMIR